MGGWQSAAPQHGSLTEPLRPFDATRPNIARAYDYLLGGKDNFAADRDLAEKLVAIYPGVRQMVAENRRCSSIIIPPPPDRPPHTHPGLCPRPSLTTCGLAAAAMITAARKPAAVLDAVQATGLIGLDQPACLILAMVLHFMDAATARDLAAAYISGLVPGSHVIITVGCGDPAIGAQITRTYDAASVHNHTPEDVASFFTGLDLISPGIADARAWQAGWSAPAPFAARAGQVLAGIGRKPAPGQGARS